MEPDGSTPRPLHQLDDVVRHYSAEMGDSFDGDHLVCSPLGVWMLLVVAGAGSGSVDIEQALGVSLEQAAAWVGELLGDEAEDLWCAVAAWSNEQLCSGPWAEWISALPEGVELGPVPDLEGAHEWARSRTAGLIDRFPGRVSPLQAIVASSALVARLRWCEPFGLAPGGELGGELGDGLDAVLHVRHGGGHRFELVDTTSGGQVVALTSSAHGGHQVVSVIGIDGSAPAGDIHRGALEVTSGDVPGTDWWALPIAEGPVLSVTETVVVSDVDEDQLVVHGYLPAWEGSNSMLLSSSTAPGVGAALAALAAVAGGGDESQATQSAVARFGQYGFEAAAVTTFSVGRAPRMHTGDLVHEVRRRVVTLRFSHPYAVVAVGGTGAFASVPLFSAWVGTGCAVG